MPRDFQPRYRVETINRGALFASAKMIDTPKARQKVSSEGWQDRAWSYYDSVGEFRYAANWVGGHLSRVKLVLRKDGKIVDKGPAFDALAKFGGTSRGQQELLRQVGIHMTVAGEVYLVAYEDSFGIEHYLALTAKQVQKQNNEKWKILGKDVDHPMIIRVWRPHPQNPNHADAASKPMLNVLQNIVTLEAMEFSQTQSRLTGSGLLLLPDELTFQPSKVQQGDEESLSNDSDLNSLIAELTEVASIAVSDPSSPAARVPVILQGPAEALKEIRLVNFWTEFEDKVVELTKENIGRLALGLDMPPEILNGKAGVNHWTAWSIEESAIKAHTEPLIDIITYSLTVSWLYPMLEELKFSPKELRSYEITADISELSVRPNMSKEALELYDRGMLSEIRVRKENGFADEDAPTDDERTRMLLWRVAQDGQTSSAATEAVLRSMGVEEIPELDMDGRQKRPAPSLLDHPVTGPPAISASAVPDEAASIEANRMAAVTAYSEAAVWRALERAGNKIKTKYQIKPAGVGAADLYKLVDVQREDLTDLLDDAWTLVDKCSLSVDKSKLVQCLDTYAKVLLLDKKEHSVDLMQKYLVEV